MTIKESDFRESFGPEPKTCPECGKASQFGGECDPCRRFNDGYINEDAMCEQHCHEVQERRDGWQPQEAR